MKSEIKKLPQSQLEITIEVSPTEFRPMMEKAAVKISQEAKIEGFRPGKAPYEIIKNKFGEMTILQEAVDYIIAKTYYEVLKENNIVTIGQPEIHLEKIAPENDLVYQAKVSVLPKVKIGDYQNIKIKRNKIEIAPEQIEKIIADIQKMRAKEKLVDREAKTGDKAEVDFDVFLDQVPIEHGSQKKYPLVIGEGRFIPGFEEQVIGMKAGAEKEFPLKFPDEYYQKNLAGKLCDFKVKCQAVFEIELPAVNDEFAKEISNGHFKDLNELKENIGKNLLEEEKAKQEQKLELEMLEKIIGVCEFEEIPEVLLVNEKEKMRHELEDNIAHQGFKFEDYLSHLKKTPEDLMKEFTPQAEQRAKTAILCREIYQEQKITVREDEVEKEIEEMLKNYQSNPEAKKQLESEMYKDYLRNTIGNRKVMEYLKAKIIEE